MSPALSLASILLRWPDLPWIRSLATLKQTQDPKEYQLEALDAFRSATINRW
jgi:hypothetical protein